MNTARTRDRVIDRCAIESCVAEQNARFMIKR